MKSKGSVFKKRTGLITVFCFLMGTVMAPLAGAVEVSDDVMSQLSETVILSSTPFIPKIIQNPGSDN